MSSRHDFNAVALRFCRVLEDPPRRVSLELLQQELLELYTAAIRLPKRPATPPLPGAQEDVMMSPRWKSLLYEERYFEVFDATQHTAPLSGWLYDDVRDIHGDLRRALVHGDARKMFRFHWGAHAADALRALHWRLIGMSA